MNDNMSRREFAAWVAAITVGTIAVAIGGGMNDKRESDDGVPPADGKEPP